MAPIEATRVTGPLLTADESDEGDDDELLFSDDGTPRLADDSDDDDVDGFLAPSTVVENEIPAPAEAATRITLRPHSDGVAAERTVVAPIDFAALDANVPHGHRPEADDFDAPTMVGGAPPEAPAGDATFVGTVDGPPGPPSPSTRPAPSCQR
jgi:hypothetical protein